MYSWVAAPFPEACSGDTQTRSVTCMDADKKVHNDDHCTTVKPASEQTCAQWVEEWGQCSDACNGTQHAQNVCKSNNIKVDNSQCGPVIQPVNTRPCKTDTCTSAPTIGQRFEVYSNRHDNRFYEPGHAIIELTAITKHGDHQELTIQSAWKKDIVVRYTPSTNALYVEDWLLDGTWTDVGMVWNKDKSEQTYVKLEPSKFVPDWEEGDKFEYVGTGQWPDPIVMTSKMGSSFTFKSEPWNNRIRDVSLWWDDDTNNMQGPADWTVNPTGPLSGHPIRPYFHSDGSGIRWSNNVEWKKIR